MIGAMSMRGVPATPLWRWLSSVPSFFVQPVNLVRHYRREDLVPDLISGLTVAVVLLPQAIAYALIAELPPQMGLYSAIAGAIVGGLWGSSSHLHTGPTNAASLLVLSSLMVIATPGSPEFVAAAGLMAVMVGVARLLLGLARLGVLVNFVSFSVIVGFTAGAAILIAVNQLEHLLRVDIPSSTQFLGTLTEIMQHLPQAHWASLLLGLGTIIGIVAIQRLKPQWPATLLMMIAASLVVFVLQQVDGREFVVVGELPRGLPPLASLPLFDLELIGRLSTGALAVAVLGLVEAISIARSIAAHSGQRLDSNQEFVGQGLANIASGFLSGYTCSGSFTRSAVLYTSGGRTALASVFSGLWTLLALLLFAPLAAYLPRAALAGVLIVTAYKMIQWREIRRIVRSSPGDTLIMVATLLSTLLLPLEFAVLAGVLVSFGRYIVRTSKPDVHSVVPDEQFRHLVYQPDKPCCPQLAVITINGTLYFGATHHVEEMIRANREKNPDQRFLLLKLNRVEHCDVSGIHMLESIVHLYRQSGGDVYMMRVNEAVRTRMRLTGFEKLLGPANFLAEESALSHLFYKVLDPAVCIYECPVRVWLECQNLPKYQYPQNLPPAPLSINGVPEITPNDLRQELLSDHPPLVIDVREPREFKEGHIPQAQLIPMPKLLLEPPAWPRDRKIVFVCRTGRRSARVLATLLGHSAAAPQQYAQVSILRGGMLAWEAAGFLEAID